MNSENFTLILSIIGLFGIIGGMILIAYEDGIPQGRLKKILCKLGSHKMYVGKIAKYHCQWCKKPRSHPELKIVEYKEKI